MKLYLVRHGETVWNAEHRYQGVADVPLSELGHWQAERLADRFKEVSLSAIYASDLSRALQTAQAIARPHNLEVKILTEFREINFGEWEGLTFTDIEEKYGASFYRRWLEDPSQVCVPGGELLESVLERTLAGLDYLSKHHQDETVLVVTHGGNIMSLGCHLNGKPLSSFWDYYLGNTAVCSLEIAGDKAMIVAMNDLSHLE